MDTPSTGPRPAYLDTCVISALAKGELSPADSAGFVAISRAVDRSDLTLCASTVAKREIDQIPQAFRQTHLTEYNALRILRGSASTNWIDDRAASPTFGQPRIHPTFDGFTKVVSDRADAEHLFQAKVNGVTDFITTDRRTILNKAPQLRAAFGINAYSPAEYHALVLKSATSNDAA